MSSAGKWLNTALLPLLVLAAQGCKKDGPPVETVPPSILDPDRAGPTPPPSRTEYEITPRESVKIWPPPDKAYRTDSGLKFVVFERGNETAHPKSTTNVTVHYEGYTQDGKKFDSSVDRGEPTSFVLNQVIPGWREGVKLMTVGDTFRFWIPEKDAYRGMEGKPQGLLVFDVQLISMDDDKGEE
jgi:hypothetical protein